MAWDGFGLGGVMKDFCRGFQVFVLGFAALGAAGCASEVKDSVEESSEVSHGLVASVDVGYGTILFQEFEGEDGTMAVAIGELTHGGYEWTPLEDTLAQYTSLETFRALVPEQDPPWSYVLAHDVQAAQLGRDSNEVLQAVFDRDAPLPKATQGCKDWITPSTVGICSYGYAGVRQADNLSGQQGITLAASSKSITAGICNDGPGRTQIVRGTLRWAPPSTTSFTTHKVWTNVPAGYRLRWFGENVYGSCSPPPGGGICVPPTVSVSWRVEGLGNDYDLRGALINSVSCVL